MSPPLGDPSPTCSSRHRLLCRILLGVCVLWVMAAGLSYPLGLRGASTWPWNRSWFMFSWDSGMSSRVEVEGVLSSGERETIDPGPWFRFQVTAEGSRLQEIPRDSGTMIALADYLCAAVNRAAPPGRTLSRISIVEHTWPRSRGHRTRFEDVAADAMSHYVWLADHPCEARP